MQTLGPASESLRLTQHYREMSDGELIELAQHPLELTALAQAALANEVSARRLSVSPEAPTKPQRIAPPDETSTKSAYAEQRQIVGLCTVWSRRDALQLQNLLDAAGIPFYLGSEKAPSVDEVKSNFGDGVSVGVMRAAFPWVWGPLGRFEPMDEPADEKNTWEADLAIHCPRCRSTDVVFKNLSGNPDKNPTTQKFNWICASCGHAWQDDGIATKH